MKGLNTAEIIDGVYLDPRIDSHYYNLSFGYGGNCLPKDTRQLLANCRDVPQNMVEAVVKSNDTHKGFITKVVIDCLRELVYKGAEKPVTGVYRLVMKFESDNLRASATQGFMRRVKVKGIPIHEGFVQEGLNP